jgi:hypothetical protein
MTEAVAVPKSKNSRPLVAGILVLVILAAFAVAFYLLGGVDVVSGLVGGLLAAQPAAPRQSQSASPAPSAPASSSASTESSGLVLPSGVDDAFAKRVYVEQLESETNIAKLVDGKVASFTLKKAANVTGGVEIPIRVTFTDHSSADGILGLAQKRGNWFFVYISGKRKGGKPGQSDTVNQDGSETLDSHETTLDSKPVDVDVLNTILEQQVKSQQVFARLADGTYDGVAIDKVTPGEGTTTLDITLSGPKRAAMKGRVLCISKDIDGTKTWFITSFTKA